MRYFSTFTGIGGLDKGLEDIGATCVGFSEIKNSSIKGIIPSIKIMEI